MTVIILLGAIGLILSRLFHATFRVIDAAPRARDEVVRVEAMITLLRDDVWRGRDVRMDPPTTLVVDQIRWTIGEGLVTRSSGDDVREWKPVTSKLAFAATPSGMMLQDTAPRREADDSILLTNHARLLAENRGAR